MLDLLIKTYFFDMSCFMRYYYERLILVVVLGILWAPIETKKILQKNNESFSLPSLI